MGSCFSKASVVPTPTAVAIPIENENLLRNLMTYMEDHNIQDYGVELPQIAVMGDTSSGKSSLLSAISRIIFPSADGICTRCPTRLRMERSSAAFKASVHINWHPTSTYASKEYERTHLNDISDITEAIAAAQKTILDCAEGPSVAKDIIEINISGPDYVNLTVVDLPGIVKYVGKDENANLAAEIDSLLNEFLKRDRCVILAVLPANVHVSNSGIMTRALEVDPSTRRIIPVITKPDLIDKGAEDEVLQLLLGKQTQDFKLGFSMVKCRGQSDINDHMTLKQAALEESKFFSTRKPWKSVPDRSLFGIDALRLKLETIQIDMLKETLPGIEKELTDKRDECEKELKKYGIDLTTEGARRQQFCSIVNDLSNLVRETLHGSNTDWKVGDGFSLRAQLEQMFRKFAMDMHKTRLAGFAGGEGAKVFVTANGKQLRGTIVKVKEKQNGEIAFYVDPDASVPKEYAKKMKYLTRPKKKKESRKVKYHLISEKDIRPDNYDLLKNAIVKQQTSGLPIFPSVELFNHLVSDAVCTDWAKLCLDLVDETYDLVKNFLKWAMEKVIPAHLGPCRLEFENIVQSKILTPKYEHAKEQIGLMLEEEKEPKTQNDELFKSLTRARTVSLFNNLKSIKQTQSIDGKTTVAWEEVEAVMKQTQKKTCLDHSIKEMDRALTAYGKVAVKRAMDNAPNIVENQLLHTLHDDITTNTSSISDKDLVTMLRVGDGTTKRRRELEEKKAKYSGALKAFQKIRTCSSSDLSSV